jgi:tetratricopeptide (TPR) repeat protein
MIFDFLKLAKLYARLGSVYEKMGDVKNAKEWYQKSLLEDNNKVIVQSLHRCEAIYKT